MTLDESGIYCIQQTTKHLRKRYDYHPKKIAKIIETIESGYTVSFTTALRSYQIDLKTLNKFRKAGYELFKAKDDKIYMLCMNGCRITYV